MDLSSIDLLVVDDDRKTVDLVRRRTMVAVKSELGKGSCFSFTLPAAGATELTVV